MMAADHVRILDGNTFLVTDGNGDVEASPTFPTGLFSLDTRFLSTWKLSINGERLHALSVDEVEYFQSRFFLVPGEPTQYLDAKVSVIREQSITGSFEEQLTVLNHDVTPVELALRIELDSDFADLFDVKDVVVKKKGTRERLAESGCLQVTYRREEFARSTIVSSSEPAEIDDHGLTFSVHIRPQDEWSTCLRVETLGADGRDIRLSLQGRPSPQKSFLMQNLGEWIERAPKLHCENQVLLNTYRRSIVDLAALRYAPLTEQRSSVFAAGLPWFMSIFGRDSIFTSLQVLPFAPDFAAATLRLLGDAQGSSLDDFREEEPGKILHEVRYGESSAFKEQPHSPYYGSADATCLWVVLLDEYERWSGDVALVCDLEQEARAALAWIDEYGDLMGNGYVSYRRRNEQTGLENQCWKDSWDSISYHDGRLAPLPRATCELQGYAYDAKMRGARLAREFWNDPEYADTLEREAGELKERFNRDFWVDKGEFYALGLDPDGKPVDALSSNMGHLLWSGIVEQSRAAKVAEHLLGPRLFSGWGVRTLAVGEGRYNPIGYHVGTVWPFDSSIVAWGLRRYQFKEEAARIAAGILDAAECFNGRLPEAFAGYPREQTDYPVEYPTACSPQAWSTGAPLLLLRTMLGLQPQGDYLLTDPVLPAAFSEIQLLDIPGRWGKADAFGRSKRSVAER
jgi:glycogen debranching enzyme